MILVVGMMLLAFGGQPGQRRVEPLRLPTGLWKATDGPAGGGQSAVHRTRRGVLGVYPSPGAAYDVDIEADG